MEDKKETSYLMVDCSNYLIVNPETNTEGAYLIPKEVFEKAYSIRIDGCIWTKRDAVPSTSAYIYKQPLNTKVVSINPCGDAYRDMPYTAINNYI